MSVSMIFGLLGGIGLFLLGMQLMTDGLKIAAGRALRSILARSTATPVRGMLSGALITSIVQSSSAVTVATIGFVNAGLMTLAQAVAVIYGCNLGTTTTGWLVALVGFHVDIKALALPAIGGGMLLGLIGREGRWQASGEALAGFGVFFLGIEILKTSFAGIGEGFQFGWVPAGGLAGPIIFVGVGFLLTLLMQSSSAAIAITLTAAAGRVVPLESAAAMVIGANVGTTSTAALAALGATPNAKRTAGAHLAFNLITGLVAFLLLPWLLPLLQSLRIRFPVTAEPAAVLALFHTIFNVLGVLLLWPLTGRLVPFLKARFRSDEENEARPVFLDRNVVVAPLLAMNALTREMARIGGIAIRMAKGAVSTEGPASPRLSSDRVILDRLVEASGEFSSLIQRRKLPEDLEASLPNALRVLRYYSEMAELAVEIANEQQALDSVPQAELSAEIAHFKGLTVKLLESSDVRDSEFSKESCASALAELEEAYQKLKVHALRAGTRGEIPVRSMVDHLDHLSNIRRLAEQAEKGAVYLANLEGLGMQEP